MVMPSQVIKKILQRVLQPFLVGFTTKDLTLNFLSGKAALRDVEVNVDAINEKINENPGTPLRFTRIYVSQLSVQATVSKIKSKPIKILIDEVIMEMEEPSVVLPPRNGAQLAVPGPLDAPHRYALGDRIGDGITVHINRVLIVIRLKGLLKDAPIGAWTPPCLVVELFGVSMNSTDEHGRVYQDLAALWKAVNYKMPEVMIYKQLKIERLIVKLIPTSPSLFRVDIRQRGPLPPIPGEAVLLDQSPSPVSLNITLRKRYRDSAMLGLMVQIEGSSMVFDMLHTGGDKMMAHVLISLLQCVSRQGDIAWVDANFRRRLWAAVDKGELPHAKVYGAQGKKNDKSFFTVVETESSQMSSLKEEALEDDEDMDFLDDTTHSESSRLKDKELKLGPEPPRIVIGVDVELISLIFGASGLDGGVRVDIRGVQVDQLANIKLPMECLNASATIIEAAKLEQEDKPYMDVVQVRVSDLRVETLHTVTEDPVSTLLFTQRDLSKPTVGGHTPLRFLRRGVERGYDPALDVAVSRGRRGDFNPLLAPKKVFGHAIGVMILVPKNSKAIPFPKISSKIQVDIPASLMITADINRLTLLPDFFSTTVDSRWFTGLDWPLEEAKGGKPMMLTSRVEPMQQPAPSCMVLRFRGGMKVVLPTPEDIPTFPSLTISLKSFSVIKDHTFPRYCVEALSVPHELPSTDDEYQDPPLLPDRWTVELEELSLSLSSLSSSTVTSPDTLEILLLSIKSATITISLDLMLKKRGRASSFKRQHSIDSMLAVQRSTFNRISPDIEEAESNGIAPGLDMSYVTRAVQGTSFNISLDITSMVMSGDMLALVGASQLVLYATKSFVLASDTISNTMSGDARIAANSMARLSEVATVVAEEITTQPLAGMHVRIQLKEFMLTVPSPTSQNTTLAISIGLILGQVSMKQSEKCPDELQVDTVVGMVEEAVLNTPERESNYALLMLKRVHGFVHVDWMNLQATGEVDGEDVACVANSAILVEVLSGLARRWGTSRVAVVGCDRTNCLYGDEVTLVELIRSPTVYFDVSGHENELSKLDDIDSQLTLAGEIEGTLAALLPPFGVEVSGHWTSLEIQVPPVSGNDKWTVIRLNEVEGSLALDTPYKVEDRTMKLVVGTALAVVHSASDSQSDEDDTWTSFNSAEGIQDDIQLISPFRVDAILEVSNIVVPLVKVLEQVALQCYMQPVFEVMQPPMGEFPVDMGKGAEDRLSLALHDSVYNQEEVTPSIDAALIAAGMKRIVDSSEKPPIQQKSVPLKRVSMKPSSSLSLRLAAGTVTTLQKLVEEQMQCFQLLMTNLITNGWIPQEVISNINVGNVEPSLVAATPHQEKALETQVADDLLALGRTMKEARAAAEVLSDEMKMKSAEVQHKEYLRVESDMQGSLGANPPMSESKSLSTVHGQSLSQSSNEEPSDSRGQSQWALERLRGIQRLLATAQSLQEHTKATMTAQLSELSRKQLELEERERALQIRLAASEASEINLKKELSKLSRQLESSESRRATEEDHHERTIEKLQNKLKEALESVVSLDESTGGAAAPSRPTSSRSVMGKWMSKGN